MYLLIKHYHCSHCLLLSFSSEDEEARCSHSLSRLPCCCAAAHEPLGLSPSRCLSLPDTEHRPLCCYFKNVILSDKEKKTQHGISKISPGYGWLKGVQFFTQCPSSINTHGLTHLTKTHTKPTVFTPSALCWAHQFSFSAWCL